MNAFDKLDVVLIGLIKLLIILCSVAMSSLVFFLVLSRYFLGSSIIGVLELATIFAIWLYMLGAVLSSRNGEHLTVDLVEKSIKNALVFAIYDILRTILVLLASLFAVYLANDMLQWSLRRPQTTPALSLPLLLQQAPMIAATVFFVAYAIRDVLRAVRHFQTSDSDMRH